MADCHPCTTAAYRVSQQTAAPSLMPVRPFSINNQGVQRTLRDRMVMTITDTTDHQCGEIYLINAFDNLRIPRRRTHVTLEDNGPLRGHQGSRLP